MTFEEQLAALSDTFQRDYQCGELNACALAYTEDAIRIEVGSSPSIGRDAIVAALKSNKSRGVEILNFVTATAVADGSVGYAILTVETNYGSNSRIMLGMKRTKDGRWLVAAEAIVG